MAWTRQSNTASGNSAATTSLAIAFGSAVSAGDTLVLAFGNNIAGGAHASSVTDNNGNTWVKLFSSVDTFGTSFNLEVWWVPTANAGATTVTIAFGGSNAVNAFAQAYAGGNSPTHVAGQHAFNNQASSPMSSGNTASSAAGGELVVGAWMDHTPGHTMAVNDGKTQQYNNISSQDLIVSDSLSAAAGVQSASFTEGGTVSGDAGIMFFTAGGVASGAIAALHSYGPN